MTTVPVEYEASLSNTGAQVVPELVVFQTPPDAAAMNQTCLFRGSTARSATRPDVDAGPIWRNRNAAYGPPPPRAPAPAPPAAESGCSPPPPAPRSARPCVESGRAGGVAPPRPRWAERMRYGVATNA